VKCTVLEATDTVGGIARTANYKGYLFDMGGHRFFTKVSAVEALWKEILGPDLIRRPRLSRIYYRGRFFNYPLEPRNALFGLGLVEASRCLLSYLRAQAFPTRPERSFRDWVSNRFGRRLFEIFFRTYTEKVWGLPCDEISAEWAAQRIKDLSLVSVIADALRPRRALRQNQHKVIKTLISEFVYPRRGPGMMWERTRELIEAKGARVVTTAPAGKLRWRPGKVLDIEAGGTIYRASHFISSMAIRDLIAIMAPAPPPRVLAAARRLQYRDFLTVALILKDRGRFPDNWIYIHDPSVKVGRIQNYKSWSPEMVPDPGNTCLGLEYFCFEGDGLWTMTNADLIQLAQRELEQLGLGQTEDCLDGTVVRVPKAYPVYNDGYKEALSVIRNFVEGLENLQLVGRNGMHRYNNQDHSMLTALLAARNILGGNYDLWAVNADEEYHEAGGVVTEEEIRALNRTQPVTPSRLRAVAGD
jgi:protoporphyrinogen oxidase